MTSRRSSRFNERGDATVESVLVTPVLLLLITATINFALWYHASSIVQASAQEGLRATKVATGTVDVGRTTAESYLSQLGPRLVQNSAVDVTRDDVRATVEVDGQVPPVVPGLTLPVHARASAPLETFRPTAQ